MTAISMFQTGEIDWIDPIEMNCSSSTGSTTFASIDLSIDSTSAMELASVPVLASAWA